MKFFLDTSVFYFLFTGHNKEAEAVYFSEEKKVSNEYVVKELRRVLLNKGFSSPVIEDFISDIRKKCVILQGPSKQRIRSIVIRDRSDSPVVLGALDSGCVLATFDRQLSVDAKKYVETLLLNK